MQENNLGKTCGIGGPKSRGNQAQKSRGFGNSREDWRNSSGSKLSGRKPTGNNDTLIFFYYYRRELNWICIERMNDVISELRLIINL